MSLSGRWDVGDPEVDAFVDSNLVSFAAWDLIIYLNRNTDACEPLTTLAAVLARQESDLEPAIDRLVGNRVLVERTGAVSSYALSEDPDVRRVVSKFITMASKREHRLEFVRRVLAHVTGA
jgi:hypothetical protein